MTSPVSPTVAIAIAERISVAGDHLKFLLKEAITDAPASIKLSHIRTSILEYNLKASEIDTSGIAKQFADIMKERDFGVIAHRTQMMELMVRPITEHRTLTQRIADVFMTADTDEKKLETIQNYLCGASVMPTIKPLVVSPTNTCLPTTV